MFRRIVLSPRRANAIVPRQMYKAPKSERVVFVITDPSGGTVFGVRRPSGEDMKTHILGFLQEHVAVAFACALQAHYDKHGAFPAYDRTIVLEGHAEPRDVRVREDTVSRVMGQLAGTTMALTVVDENGACETYHASNGASAVRAFLRRQWTPVEDPQPYLMIMGALLMLSISQLICALTLLTRLR